jgi:hypothetical protein
MDVESFAGRSAIGAQLEHNVYDALADMGFQPDWFDRRRHSDKFCLAIRGAASVLFRHAPDIVVAGGDHEAFIECKSASDQHRESPNYSIEIDCHLSMMRWARTGAPSYYVFHDFQISAVGEIEAADKTRRPAAPGRTPYFLVPKSQLEPRHLVDDDCLLTDPDFYFDCLARGTKPTLFEAS